MVKRFVLVWLGPIIALTQACSVCTLVGCSSGTELLFSRAPQPGAVITLDLGDGVPWVVDCSQQVCGARVRFTGLIVEAARVVVTEGEETSEFNIQPLYERLQPNGPSCEPTCRVAEVPLDLP